MAIAASSGGGGVTLADKTTKTVTTINLCRSTFNKFIIVTPAVSIDRDCDGGPGTVDMEVVMEEANGLGLSRTIAVVRDENNNDSNTANYRDSYGGQSDHGQSTYNNNNTTWNQWWCSLVYSAVRCFGSGSATAAGTTTKLLQPCQYRRGWLEQQRRRCEEKQKVKMKWDMNNNGFYSRRGADGTYEL